MNDVEEHFDELQDDAFQNKNDDDKPIEDSDSDTYGSFYGKSSP